MAAPNYDSNIQPLSFTCAPPGRIRPRSRSSTFSDWNFKRNKPRHTPSLSLQNANQLRPKRFAEWDTPSSSDLDTPSSRTISQHPPSSIFIRPPTPQNLQQDVYPQARARLRNDPPLGMPRGPRPRSQSVTTFIAPTRNNSQDEVTRPAPVFIPERSVTPFPWETSSRESPGGEVSPTVPKQGPWKRIPSFKMASLSSKLKVSKLPFRRQAFESKQPKSPVSRTSSEASRPSRPRPTLSILYDPTTGRISGIENVFPGVDPVSLLPPGKADNIRIGISDRWNPDKIKELCLRFLKDLPIKIPDTFNLVVSTVLPNRASERPEISLPLTAEPLTATSDGSHTLLPSPEERSSEDKPTQNTRGRSVIFSQYISFSPSNDDILPQSTATSPTEETKLDAIPPLFPPSDQWAQEVLSVFTGPSSLGADGSSNLQLHPVGYF